MKNQNKKPQGSRPGVSASALLGQQSKHRLRARQLQASFPPLPPLNSLADELGNLINMVIDPNGHVFMSRRRTINGNRWLAASRVARAAMLEGRSPEWIAPVLLAAASLKATPEWHFTPSCADFVVTAELNTLGRAGATP